MKDKIKGCHIHRRVHKESTRLARITVKFLKAVRKSCKKYHSDYNQTLSFMLKSMIERELTENAD